MSDNDRPNPDGSSAGTIPDQDKVDTDKGTFWVLVSSVALAAAALYLSWRRTPGK